jgi:hypothetical protein
MVTMPKHVGVMELKNTLAVNCVFVGAIKPLMYRNARNEQCRRYNNFCGYEIYTGTLKGRTAVWGLLMVGAEEKEVI